MTDLSKTIDSGVCISITVSNMKLKGIAIDPNQTYLVTANNFLADGGDNFNTFGTLTATRLDCVN